MVHPGVVCIAGPAILIAAIFVADRLTLADENELPSAVVQSADSAATADLTTESPATGSFLAESPPTSDAVSPEADPLSADTVSLADFPPSSSQHSETAGDSDLRTLLQQFAPDASPDVIDVWVESYRGMSVDDVMFLMQQREALGLQLPASLSGADDLPTDDSGLFSVPLPVAADDSSPLHAALTAAADSVRRNLLFSATPGYRREMFVLNIGPAKEPGSAGGTDVSVVSYETTELFGTDSRSTPSLSAVAAQFPRVFGVGVHVPSASRLHVALGDDAELMFRFLDGLLLSRRGDFQVLSDGRIGIVTPDGELPLYASPVVPADMTVLQIDAHGDVSGLTPDGESLTVGMLPIARCHCLQRVPTADGVYFRVASASDLTAVDPATVFLRVRAVEYSNVDRGKEWQELDHVQRMLAELNRLID